MHHNIDIMNFLYDFGPPCILAFALAIYYDKTNNRKKQRIVALLYLALAGGWFIFLGDRWTINSIKIKYVGYFLTVFSLIGFSGINIWRGGPLDPLKDDYEEKNTLPKSFKDDVSSRSKRK